MSRVIPVEYRKRLPDGLTTAAWECLKSVPHSWLLPTLFRLIWTRLRSVEQHNHPDWDLATWITAHLDAEGLDSHPADHIPGEILVKHAVSFFYIIVQTTAGATGAT